MSGYTDDDLLAALRAAAAEAPEKSLTVKAYEAHHRAHGGPSSARIIQRLGSWRAALEGAGLPARAGGRQGTSQWSDADLLAVLRDYLAAEGSTGSHGGYLAWARGRDVPSGQTLRNRFDGWADAVRRARAAD